jgi:phosphohistidine phosphatase
MKKLLLIRHAEAQSFAEQGDFYRPLSAKGTADATALAQKLEANGLIPDELICSQALRTTSTANIIASQLRLQPARQSQAIYEASEKTLLTFINHINDQVNFAALVGHNPGIAYLLLNLTGKVRDVPPCTAIMIVFEDADSWHEITNDSGVITYYYAP